MTIADYKTYNLTKDERRKFLLLSQISISILLYLFYMTWLVVIPAMALSFFAIKPYEKYKADKRREFLRLQFRDLLYSLSSSISAGRHMMEALEEAVSNLSLLYENDSPMMLELKAIITKAKESHQSEELLLKDFAERSRVEDIKMFVDVYYICRSTGGNLTAVISKSSEIILDKLTIERDIKCYVAQKRYEGKIISIMPVGIILFLNILSPGYLTPLYQSLDGRVIMTFCLAMGGYAYYLTDKITRINM